MLKKIFNTTKTLYSPEFPKTVTYMLQSKDYRAGAYLVWFWTANDFSKIRNQQKLDKTQANAVILSSLRVGIFLEFVLAIVLAFLSVAGKLHAGWVFGIAALLAFPVIWSHLVCVPAFFVRIFIVKKPAKAS